MNGKKPHYIRKHGLLYHDTWVYHAVMLSDRAREKLYLSLLPDHKHMAKYLRGDFGKPTGEDVFTVMKVLNLSDRFVADLFRKSTRRVREWKAGKKTMPVDTFAVLVASGSPDLYRWLLDNAGFQWWKKDYAIWTDDAGNRRIAILKEEEKAA